MEELETYLKENLEKGIIDHAIRASFGPDGKPVFYIHAAGHNSSTLDFKVDKNTLIPMR